jgi:hypothetical protein
VTVYLVIYFLYSVAILVDKWVARLQVQKTSEDDVVAILVDKWVASFAVFAKLNPINVAILADKKVNKFNREMLQIVHFPFLCCQPNRS